MEPFIHNHQMNTLRSLGKFMLGAVRNGTDRRMLEAVRSDAERKLAEAFPAATDPQLELLKTVLQPSRDEELTAALSELEAYLAAPPPLTEKALRALFPKAKKLKPPPLAELAWERMTYLGWLDVAADKMYLALPKGDGWTGIEGRIAAAGKKNVCAFCNGYGEVGLFTAVTKARMADNPDYYKAVGNYICTDSAACNERITSVEAVEAFFANVTR